MRVISNVVILFTKMALIKYFKKHFSKIKSNQTNTDSQTYYE